jgi:hypothetical protein
MADGILRRVTPKTWQGTLGGFTVIVSLHGDRWHAHVVNPPPRRYTRVVLPGRSLRDAAAKARAWIEANGD